MSGLNIGELVGTISLQDQFSGPIEAAAKKLGIAGESFSAITGAAGLAVGAIAATTGAIVTLASRGAVVADVQDGFYDLAESAGGAAGVLSALRDGTQGTISDFDLMTKSSGLLSSGLITSAGDMGTLAAGAKLLSGRVGGDTSRAFDTLAQSIAAGRDKSLKALGLFVDSKKAAEDYAQAIGKTPDKLSAHERAAGLAAGVTSELKKQLELAGPPVKDFGDFVDIGKSAVSNFVDKLSVAVATSPVVQLAMGGIASAVQTAFGGTQQDAVKTLTGFVNDFAIFIVEAAKVAVEGTRVIVTAFDGAKAVFNGFLGAMSEGVAKVAGYLADLAAKGSSLPGTLGENFKATGDALRGVADFASSLGIGFNEMGLKALDSAARTDEAFKNVANVLGATADKMRIARDAAGELTTKTNDVAGAIKTVGDDVSGIDTIKEAITTTRDFMGDAARAIADKFKALQDEMALSQTEGIERRLLELELARDREIAGLQELAFAYPAEYDKLVAAVQQKYGLMTAAAVESYVQQMEAASQGADGQITQAERALAGAKAALKQLESSDKATQEQIMRARQAYAQRQTDLEELKKNEAIERFDKIASSASTIISSLFGKNKAAAIATAIIDAAAAFVKALSSAPPPLNFIQAAAVAAAAAAQIVKIKSTDLGFAAGTPGTSFVDFGAGSVEMLHGREAVINQAQGATLGEVLAGMVRDELGRRDDRVAIILERIEDGLDYRDRILPDRLRDAGLLAKA